MSKTVSTNNKSTPPSTKASICALYAILKSSNVTALNPGSLTSGDMLAVRFVGPIDPATNLGLFGSLALNSLATSLAIFADS